MQRLLKKLGKHKNPPMTFNTPGSSEPPTSMLTRLESVHATSAATTSLQAIQATTVSMSG